MLGSRVPPLDRPHHTLSDHWVLIHPSISAQTFIHFLGGSFEHFSVTHSFILSLCIHLLFGVNLVNFWFICHSMQVDEGYGRSGNVLLNLAIILSFQDMVVWTFISTALVVVTGWPIWLHPLCPIRTNSLGSLFKKCLADFFCKGGAVPQNPLRFQLKKKRKEPPHSAPFLAKKWGRAQGTPQISPLVRKTN